MADEKELSPELQYQRLDHVETIRQGPYQDALRNYDLAQEDQTDKPKYWTLQQFSTNPVGEPWMALKQFDEAGVQHAVLTGTRPELAEVIAEHRLEPKELPAISEAEYYRRSAEAAGRDIRPVEEMTNREIVSEARELHAHFRGLAERYEKAPAMEKAEIREEMAPLVNRENELRQEFTGRLNPEMKQDRVPEQQISYGY